MRRIRRTGRQRHVQDVADAIAAGKIAPKDEAAKDFWKRALTEDYVAASKQLNALPKNPAFCDHLLTTALQQRYPNLELQPLDDAAELAAHNTMRDRLLKK